MTKYNKDNIKNITKELLTQIGEDPEREGLLSTPDRVSRAWEYLSRGYRQDIKQLINNAIFNEKYDQMVAVKDIEFHSMCEHHLLPFFGHAHIAYIPNGKIVGLSKIPRILDMFSRRLQVQERMTQEVAGMLNDVLEPKGVAVIIEAQHMCMQMRGVEKKQSYMSTSAMLGIFRDDDKTRKEFLDIVKLRKKF
ncbi:MAG: GTP cyclohydrolase I FolE [Candidatus Marinimicrobia bacterium]|nr:GTP cyclohydrolase I FolE [Candidatus Neomarinimicrobiota bacterium]|tara:strand:- start:11595 stop:12173 length:579 start_codon:yes stop_codon:yes gene_type:complete